MPDVDGDMKYVPGSYALPGAIPKKKPTATEIRDAQLAKIRAEISARMNRPLPNPKQNATQVTGDMGPAKIGKIDGPSSGLNPSQATGVGAYRLNKQYDNVFAKPSSSGGFGPIDALATTMGGPVGALALGAYNNSQGNYPNGPYASPSTPLGNPGVPIGGASSSYDLNDPYNWKGIAAALAAANQNSGVGNNPPVGNFGGGNPTGASLEITSDMAGTTPTPYQLPAYVPPNTLDVDALYNKLIAAAKGYGANSLSSFDEARKQLIDNYATLDPTLKAQSAQARAEAEASAAALGANPGIYKDWDQNSAQLANVSASTQADNLSFIDKLKLLKGDDLNASYAGLEEDRAAKKLETQQALLDYALQWQQEQIAAELEMEGNALKREQMALQWEEIAQKRLEMSGAGSSGGGGGSYYSRRGGSGGSSGSGSLAETATETQSLDQPNDLMNIQNLAKTDPEAAKLLFDAYLKNSANPEIKSLYNDNANSVAYNTGRAQASRKDPTRRFKAGTVAQQQLEKLTAKVNEAQTARTMAAIWGNMPGSGMFNNPFIKQTVTTTGKNKK